MLQELLYPYQCQATLWALQVTIVVCHSDLSISQLFTAAAVEAVQKDCKTLEQLVESHDVVYLLMDTRESRWLPTLLATAMGKVRCMLY